MKRRQFLTLQLKISALGALALSGAAVAHRLIWDYESAPQQLAGNGAQSPSPRSVPAAPAGAPGSALSAPVKLRCLSPRELVIVRAVALRILDGADPDPQADGALPQCLFIDDYLAELHGALRSDVKALFSLLELYPTLTGRFTRFSRLSPAAQDAVLTGWEHSRIALLRQAMQALKAMCFLAHYQDERSFQSLGYSGALVPVAGLGHTLPAR